MTRKRSFVREHWRVLPGAALLAFGLVVATRFTLQLVAMSIVLWLVLFAVLFTLVAGAVVLVDRWKNRGKPRPLPEPRARLDERGVSYGRPGEEHTIPWASLDSLAFYYGAPDYDDPMFGGVWDREWRFRSRELSLEIDGYYLDLPKLVKWAERKLPGFDASAARAAWDSDAGEEVVLWSSERQRAA